ncbi:4-hydroxy-3-methylbut-2-enyl diphosphate reductase [Desulfobaculum xiamenense]|uniref:4-hydroxy-3-methylbut-2-enyl diphosphate reductase n=1 Tax=Desulfobaculum xiamenense TaxID=995050 RepID=A0A846QJ25_9BACT|nr:4-hydroxy-3-methylbut-2-enyl diphosphate reductase [Desulfobaculum xiamenense]NJB67057.1 4-hydroxy-3-methylbut-2-enyl diphosphate reductase [Desulfobaculum xiamenense]
MDVILAETAGFCMGVSLALKKLDSTLEEATGNRIRTLGPIIHNPQVLEAYAARGVDVITTPAEAMPGDTVVIRAHGVPQETERELQARGVTVHDATCPRVKKAQLLIARQTERGRTLLLYGEADHPEVRGLLSYADKNAIVFETLDELKERVVPGTDYFLAAQTTQDRKLFEKIHEYLKHVSTRPLPVLETICDATRIRQDEAIRIAREVEAMVVAGGRNSGNTRRLVQVVRDQGTPCTHVETADELNADDFRGLNRIGLTAGASTPDKIIREIVERLQSF